METISRVALTFLLNSLWQIPVVVGVALLAGRFLRNSPGAYRHAVWIAALLVSVLLPLKSVERAATGERVSIAIPADPVPAATAAVARSSQPAATAESTTRTLDIGELTAVAVLGFYGVFLAFSLVRLIRAFRRTSAIRRAARRPELSLPVARIWARCQRAFRVEDAELLASSELPAPVALGWWRKAIILPEALLDEQSEEVLATAIGHEMAHLARRDYPLAILFELLSFPVAFHPAMAILRRGLERTREVACDEMVVRHLMTPADYARSLMNLATRAVAVLEPGYTMGVFDGDILEERIRRLVQGVGSTAKYARALLATGLAALILSAVVASSLAWQARAQNAASADLAAAKQAFLQAKFNQAIERLETVIRQEPTNDNARLLLADALIAEFFAQKGQPGDPLLADARLQYKEVLSRNAASKPALHGLMQVAVHDHELEEAAAWARQAIALDPNDKGAFYTVGVGNWAIVYADFQKVKQASGAPPQDYYIPDGNLRKQLRDQDMARVEEGFRMLETALELDPQYDDAMAYMNLLCRLKAGMVDDRGEADQWIRKADEWVQKALATKKQRAETGAPPRSTTMVPAPPPPPPPPTHNARFDRPPTDAIPTVPRNALEQPGTFLQIGGKSGVSARDMVSDLRGKGFNAVYHGTANETVVRVMVGPYFDPQSIAKAKQTLDAAGYRVLRTW